MIFPYILAIQRAPIAIIKTATKHINFAAPLTLFFKHFQNNLVSVCYIFFVSIFMIYCTHHQRQTEDIFSVWNQRKISFNNFKGKYVTCDIAWYVLNAWFPSNSCATLTLIALHLMCFQKTTHLTQLLQTCNWPSATLKGIT